MAVYIQAVEEKLIQTTPVLAYVFNGRMSAPLKSLLVEALGTVNYRRIGSYLTGTLLCTGAHCDDKQLVVHLLHRPLPWNVLVMADGTLVGAPTYAAKRWPLPVGTRLVRELRR